jgi:hypothetical protein
MEAWRLTIEAWRICMLVVADKHHRDVMKSWIRIHMEVKSWIRMCI